jgi:hypothetical protein
MNEAFWNEKFEGEEYAYGTHPNVFFKAHIDAMPPGNVLLPGEGEGRNAAYAASQGWEVYAFDISFEALKKATKLAQMYGVSIHYTQGGYADIDYEPESMDMIALIFAHLTPEVRTNYYQKILKSLKKGGKVILEGFHTDQMGKSSGGPKNREMLYDQVQLEADFGFLTDLEITKVSRILDEGPLHQGEASLIQMVGWK